MNGFIEILDLAKMLCQENVLAYSATVLMMKENVLWH